MDSKDQNLDLTQTKRIYFCPFQSIFIYWIGPNKHLAYKQSRHIDLHKILIGPAVLCLCYTGGARLDTSHSQRLNNGKSLGTGRCEVQ